MTSELVRGLRVLDVGCGAGRFTEVLSRWGAQVVAADLSAAVYAAARNLDYRDNVTFVAADLFALPVPPAHFDLVLAWSVLHRTPDTVAAFRAVARYVRPGGSMAVYVHGKSKGSRRRMIDPYRNVTTRLPKRVLYALCLLAGPMHYLCKIQLLGNLLRVLIPVCRHPTWRERLLETFDECSPRYAWRHTSPEVQSWFVEAGMALNRLYDPPIYAVGWLPERPAADGRAEAGGDHRWTA